MTMIADEEQSLDRFPTKMVATRLPSDLAIEVERAAARELLSVASYCRRAILQAVRGQTDAV